MNLPTWRALSISQMRRTKAGGYDDRNIGQYMEAQPPYSIDTAATIWRRRDRHRPYPAGPEPDRAPDAAMVEPRPRRMAPKAS